MVNNKFEIKLIYKKKDDDDDDGGVYIYIYLLFVGHSAQWSFPGNFNNSSNIRS